MADDTVVDEVPLEPNPKQTLKAINQHEPDYEMNATVPLDVVKDWIFNMIRENTQNIRSTDKDEGCFAGVRISEFIFSTCHKLGLARDVKHHALALFDRFQRVHLQDLHDLLRVAPESLKKKLNQWNDIENRIGDQMALRIISCIHISNKLVAPQGTVLTMDFLRDELIRLGHTYTKKQILKSEMRVLKTLKYRVNITTACVIIQTLIKALGMWDESFHAKEVSLTSWDVLDVVVINKMHIYRKLLININQSDSDKLHFVQSDNILLACAVLVTAVAAVTNADNAVKIGNDLHKLCGIPVEDITDLSGTILRFIIDRNREIENIPADDESDSLVSADSSQPHTQPDNMACLF